MIATPGSAPRAHVRRSRGRYGWVRRILTLGLLGLLCAALDTTDGWTNAGRRAGVRGCERVARR